MMQSLTQSISPQSISPQSISRVAAAAVLTVVLASPSSALAQQGQPDKILDRMDTDGDGKVFRSEWVNQSGMFKKIDTDGDEILTRAELEAQFGGGSSGQKAGQASGGGVVVDWIDVHTHPVARGQRGDISKAMDAARNALSESRMTKMVLMPPPGMYGKALPTSMEDFLALAKKDPGKFAIMGGGGTLNPMIHNDGADGKVDDKLKQRFRLRAEDILAKGAIGFGEIAILHVSLEESHPFEMEAGDHPLLLLLADIAAEHDVPIDIHFDPVTATMKTPQWLDLSRNPPSLDENIAGFERLLAHNRKAKIVWAHAGSDTIGNWTPELSRRLLKAHPNLFMSLRLTPAKVPKNHTMSEDGIKPEWLALFQEFPDRFVIGGDQFFVSTESKGPAAVFAKNAAKIRSRAELFLARLPAALAGKIGHQNTVRLYKLKN